MLQKFAELLVQQQIIMSFQAWDTYFAPLNSLNFGIGGDCTEHVLWRIENGELDGVNPKVKKNNSLLLVSF